MSDVLGDSPQRSGETTHDPHDLWRVQLGTGEIRVMTLDALDAAFDEGLIDERTPVLAPFAPTWSTLGIVAGLDDTQPDLTPSLSPVALSAPPPPLPSTATDRLVALDAMGSVDLELPDAAEMRPRRGVVIGVVATSMVGLIALPIVITSITDSAPVDVKATSVGAQLPPAPSSLPSPKSEEPKSAGETAVSPRPRLDEAQTKQLAEADKAREERSRADKAAKAAAEKAAAEKAAGATGVSAPAAPKKKIEKPAPALLNGGDRFDPLNGAL